MVYKLYLIALPVFVVFDAIWLSLIAKNFYSKHIGFLMKSEIGWFSAILFYLIFIFGLVIFVIKPTLTDHSFLNAIIYGALFGLVTYATYDLTNLATIKNWPMIITIVDLLWGAFIAAAVSGVTFWISTNIYKS